MKEIKLTKGYSTQVDEWWFDYLNQWKWHAKISKNTVYAIRKQWHPATEQLKGYYETIQMHRIIMGTTRGMLCDHADHNGLNNQEYNLRNCTIKDNVRNTSSRKNARSKYLGVHYSEIKYNYKDGVRTERKKSSRSYGWCARINPNRKAMHLKYSDNQIDAALAYNTAALKYFGEFAHLNVVPSVRYYQKPMLIPII